MVWMTCPEPIGANWSRRLGAGVRVPPVPWMTVRPERRSLQATAGGSPCPSPRTSRTVEGAGRLLVPAAEVADVAGLAGDSAAPRARVAAATRAAREAARKEPRKEVVMSRR